LPDRTLVIETATTACSVALVEGGAVIHRRHEVVGRGHAERLVPMIAGLNGGGRADRILVDVGPGSFTGVRVGIAAARGLALGWGAAVAGCSSLALVAAAAFARRASDDGGGAGGGELAAVLEGGHGEVFMQTFAAAETSDLTPLAPLISLAPEAALVALGGRRAVGNGVHWLRVIEPAIDAEEALPDAADAVLLPPALAALSPRPLYGRAPDAKLPVAKPR
jgi:tRNA threonylcarbamoyl adenosine modification protein YeaZ